MPPFDLANQVPDQQQSLPKKASSWIDQFFAPVGQPLGSFAGSVARGVTRPFASPQTTERVGQGVQQAVTGLPRTVAETAPFMLKSAPGWAKVAGLADVSLRSFAESNPGATLGERLGSSALQTAAFLGAPKAGEVMSRMAPQNFVARRALSAAGNVVGMEAANVGSAALQGQLGEYNPLTPEHLASTAVGVLPWEVGLGWHDYMSHKRDEQMTKLREVVPNPQPIAQQIPPEPPEKLVSAAWKSPEGKVETGKNHPEILQRLGVKGFEVPESRNTPDFGFTTDKGRFISREEAGPLSVASGQNLQDFGLNEPVHSDEVSMLSTQPMRIPVHDLDDLHHLEDLDHSAVTILNRARSGSELPDRKPGERLLDYYTRTLLGDYDLSKPNDPDTLLRTTKGYFDWYFKDILKLPVAEADKLTYFGLRIAAAAGANQGEVRVVPALPYTENGMLKAASFYNPSRAGLPNAFIGLLGKVGHTDHTIFDTFHSLGHELYHGAVFQATGKTFTSNVVKPEIREAVLKMYDSVKDFSQAEMAQSIQSVLRSMGTAAMVRRLNFRQEFYTETPEGRQEFLADMFGLVAMGAASPRKSAPITAIDDLMRYSNEDFKSFMRGMIQDLGTVLKPLRDYASKVFGWKQSTIAKLDGIYSNMKRLMATSRQADLAVQAFLKINDIRSARPWSPVEAVSIDKLERLHHAINGTHFDPEFKALAQEVSPMVIPQSDKDPVIPHLDPVDPLGHRLKPWDYFTPISQMGQQIPKLADMGWLGRKVGSMSKEFVSTVSEMFRNPATGNIATDDVVRLAKDGTDLNKAWSKVMLIQNALEGDREGQRLKQDELNKIPEYVKLDPKDRERFDRLNDQRAAAMLYLGKKHYDSFRSNIGVKFIAQGLMSHDRSLKWQDAQQIGEALAGLYLDSDVYSLDPQTGAEMFGDRAKMKQRIDEYTSQGPAQVNTVAKMAQAFTHDESGNEVPLSGNKTMQALMAHRQQLMGNLVHDEQSNRWSFKGRPGYSPEVRLGRWVLAWKEKGEGREPMLVGFKEKGEFDKRLEKLNKMRSEGKIEYLRGMDRTDKSDQYSGMSPDRFRLYNQAVESMTNSVLARLGQEHPELSETIRRELTDDLKPARAVASVLESPYMKERRLIGGREELNIAEGMVHYFSNSAHTIAKRYETGQHSLYLKDPVMRDNPQLQQVARKYFSEITDPSERGYSWLKKLIAFNYIFFSPSLAFVEGTQQFTNHVPALAMRGVGVGQALKMLKDGNVDAVQAYLEGKRKGLTYNVYRNAEETEVIRDARNKGIIGSGVGWQQEFWDLQKDLQFINQRNFFGGSGEVIDRTSLLGRPLYHMYKVGANLHGIAIALNTEVAFLTAFRHFRSSGLSKEASFREADELTVESMHGGGRASRPLWYLGVGPGSPGATVGSLMYSLQMYVYNTVAQMGRYLSQAIKNTAKNPVELSNAHRAAATMLGAQLVLAGVGGIPITGQMIALIEQMFPTTEPRRRMREAFFGAGKWLNSKAHLVGNDEDMGQFVQTAASDGLMSAVAPWNMANRFELGVLMGVDPYKGFDWKNVIGPAGPLLEQVLLKPAQAASKGDYTEALTQAIPNSNIRRLAETAAHGWELRTQDSRLNVKLDDAERVLLASGFTPRRVAEFRELDQMKRRAEKVHSLEQKEFHEHEAELVIGGNSTQVQSDLLRRAISTPNYDPRQGAERVAELVLQRTTPFDPLRTGSKTSQSYRIGRLFDESARQPQLSEVDRLLQKVGITQSLGFPAQAGRRELMVAQQVDQLMAANPRMSRQEALSMLMRVMNPRVGMYSSFESPSQ